MDLRSTEPLSPGRAQNQQLSCIELCWEIMANYGIGNNVNRTVSVNQVTKMQICRGSAPTGQALYPTGPGM